MASSILQPLDKKASGLAFVLGLVTIVAAWGSQLIGGLVPCELCLEQRMAYYYGLPLLLVVLLTWNRLPLAVWYVAMVIADTPEQPKRELTADFAYCRLQGPARSEASGYTPADIADWAATIKAWSDAGRDVFAYFVHEDKLHAPANAIALRQALGISLPDD